MTKKEEAALARAARQAEKLKAEKARTEELKFFEKELQQKMQDESLAICGIDEAGRGPFAGPVVAGAVILDFNDAEKEILYLNDSKKLSEKKRELLYGEILKKAVAVGVGYSGSRIIDQINILQATYRAMRMAISNLQNVSDLVSEEDSAHTLVQKLIRRELPKSLHQEDPSVKDPEEIIPEKAVLELTDPEIEDSKKADPEIPALEKPTPELISSEKSDLELTDPEITNQSIQNMGKIVPAYILADAVTIPGIAIPQKGIIKGDAKSVSIAAASIIAKVTRDHIMYEYDRLYPEYGFASHKGYGTAAHIAAIKEHGMLDIHRRSFIHF